MAWFLDVKVKPCAGRSVLACRPDGQWRAELKAVPEDGKANAELVALVARHFQCPRGTVSISAGRSARLKRVRIEGEGPPASAAV